MICWIKRSCWICILLCVLFSAEAQAQDLFQRADSQAAAGKFTDAEITLEYIVFSSAEDSVRNRALLQKSYLQKQTKKYTAAQQSLQRIPLLFLTDSLRYKVLYESALNAYLNRQFGQSEFELLRMQMLISDTLIIRESRFLYILTLLELRKFAEAKQAYEAYATQLPAARESTVLFADGPKLKKRRRAEFLATFFPGMGQVYIGKTGHGLINTGLVAGGIAFGVYNIYKGYYLTGAYTGFLFSYIFYTGGIRYTSDWLDRRNAQIIDAYNEPIRQYILQLEKERNGR